MCFRRMLSIGLTAVLSIVAFGRSETAPANVPESAPAVGPAESPGLPIGPEDRIVFLGDELIDTPHRQGRRLPTNFSILTESFLTVRYPDLHPSYYHVGWLGDTAGGALARLDRDVLVHDPTVVVICLGINDPGYRPFEEARLEQFKQEMAELVKRCQATGAKVWLISPPSVEEDHQRARATMVVKDGQRENVNLRGIRYNQTLGKYAAAVGEVAAATGSGFVDWYGQLNAARDKARAETPQIFFTYDGRIPDTRSQALAAAALLRAWGAEPIMVQVELDWAGPKAAVRTHASAEPVGVPVEVTAEGRRILELKNLPMPWPIGTPQQDVISSNWEAVALCQYQLKMTDPPADGVMFENGDESQQKQVFPAEALREGINLLNTGPLRQSSEVASLASMMALKNTYQYATWRKLELEGPLEPELSEAHARLRDAWNAFADGYGDIVRNRSKFIDLTLVLVEPSAAQSRPATRPAQPRLRVLPTPADDDNTDDPSATAPGAQEEESE